jgi:hypothetical protein
VWVEIVGETMRAALNDLATTAPDWLKGWVSDAWFKESGLEFDAPTPQFPMPMRPLDEPVTIPAAVIEPRGFTTLSAHFGRSGRGH